jgi:pyruvate/2-oxoglutarate dehydrogenase complex dihydrolipoamide acyltransferase (E2) component
VRTTCTTYCLPAFIIVRGRSSLDGISDCSHAAPLRARSGAHQSPLEQVTIDVRAPSRGTVRAILIKEEDMVTVGQTIAVLDDDDAQQPSSSQATSSVAAGAKPEGEAAKGQDKAASPPPPAQADPYEELHDAARQKAEGEMRGSKARIQFPPRKTESGLTISSMPAVDQQKYVQRGVAAKEGGDRGSGTKAPLQESAAHQKKGGREAHYLKEQVPRSEMSEAEMEAVMLGGAM